MTLALLRYNNYYNRIIKRRATLGEYEANGEVIITFKDIAFNPNDGISTEQIINYDGPIPDYVILSADGYEPTSRWFVIEAVRTRAGQYKLSLYRDVIADWWDEVVAAPTFIEKAMLTTNNDLIFNNENMTYNQIKTNETIIDDNSGTAWYAAYISSDVGQLELTVPETQIRPDIEVSSLDKYDFHKYQTEDYLSDYNGAVLFGLQARNPYHGATFYDMTFRYTVDARNNEPAPGRDGSPNWPPVLFDLGALPTGISTISSNNTQGNDYAYVDEKNVGGSDEVRNGIEVWKNIISTVNTNKYLLNESYTYTGAHKNNPIWEEDGKTIYDITEGKLYKISVKHIGRIQKTVPIPTGSELALRLAAEVSSTGKFNSPVGNPFTININCSTYRIVYNEIIISQKSITIPANRRSCQNVPYDILLFPKSRIRVNFSNDEYSVIIGTTNPILTERAIKQLMLKLAANSQLYDVQLVPYCPIPEELMYNWRYSGSESAGEIILNTKYTHDLDYTFNNSMLIFYMSENSFSKILKDENRATYATKLTINVPDDPIDFKVANECDKYRLCSPNYNGAFEFSATKNRGVSGYNITCSYKPYTPYIKVAPIFSGLYGNDFEDARGLICGGDFSISQISNAFTNYELNNKNYQVIFDRQIQNMEVNNAVQREIEIWSAVTGTLGGTAGGVIGGSAFNPIGAGIGGVFGTGVSLAAGIRDISLADQLRNEAIDFSKDQFGYQLGNIKALPYNLTKVSALNADNKLFPFLEYYTATEREKVALRSKINYNGMTVMVIDNIANYLRATPSYIKGKIIRLEGIDDDFHVVNTIAREINNGVYI